MTLGILWGAANTDLQAAKDDLRIAEKDASKLGVELSMLQDRHSNVEAEHAGTKLVYLELETRRQVHRLRPNSAVSLTRQV